MDILAITLRFTTYGVLSLVAGMPLFLWMALGSVRGRALFARWRFPYAALALLGAVIAFCTLICATAMMAGMALLPVDWDMVTFIVSGTASGKAMAIRCLLLILLTPLALTAHFRTATLVAIPAAATLAWSGHAAASEGAAGWFHLTADIAHIVAAALWIGGMACLLLSLRRTAEATTLPMLHAFAWIGTITVALLVSTGLVNGIMILGWAALPDLLGTSYGRFLAVKILLFAVMLCLAANNRFRLVPAYERRGSPARIALIRAISVEIGIALIILAIVGWLGMIDPAAPA